MYLQVADHDLYLHSHGGAHNGAHQTLHPCPKGNNHYNCQWKLNEVPVVQDTDWPAGYCLKANGHDQNSGVVHLAGGDFGTAEKRADCYERCKAYSEQGSITFHGHSNYAKSFDDFSTLCPEGSKLPTFEQICPNGVGSTPVGGRRSESDMWMPIAPQPNGNKWVQIGRRSGGTCNPLSTYHSSVGSWMENRWTRSYKGVYGCLKPHGWRGCEVIYHQSNRGCYVHTQPVNRANGVGNHHCLVNDK